MQAFEQRQRIDLARENDVLIRRQPIVRGDKGALKWIVEVTLGGMAVDLTGASVSVSCARADDTGTVNGTGSIEGGCAVCVLPEGAANVPGPVLCTMSVTAGGDTVAVAQMAVTAVDPIGGKIVLTPEDIVRMEQLAAQITAAQDAAAAANTAAAKINGMSVTVTTLAAGSAATSALTLSGGKYNLALGIPRGDKGNPGDVSSVCGVAPGANGNVALSVDKLGGRGKVSFSLAASAFSTSPGADGFYHASITASSMTATCDFEVYDLAGTEGLTYMEIDSKAGQADVAVLPKPTAAISGKLCWWETGA